MLINVATVFAGLIGVGIIFVGVLQIFAPQGSAGFGIPDTPTSDRTFRAWLTVKSVRDIASGIFVFLLMIAATTDVLGWFMLAAAGIPLGDALVVWRSKGPKSAIFGIHGATAAVMLAISAVLLVA